MTAQDLVSREVLYCQSSLIVDMILADMIPNENLYPFLDDVLEWWLVTDWLARQLQDEGEVIVEDYGCCWWGRQTSGQALYMDSVIQSIAEE